MYLLFTEAYARLYCNSILTHEHNIVIAFSHIHTISQLISILHTQQAQNICITFVQRRPNVFDVGPTLYKCFVFTGTY